MAQANLTERVQALIDDTSLLDVLNALQLCCWNKARRVNNYRGLYDIANKIDDLRHIAFTDKL